MIFVNTVEIGLFICATYLTTYLTSFTFTEIMKKIFYDIHETSTDMYTWNACVMALFMVTIITQLKCFTVRRNFHELQTFYANCLARIMMEKPELCGSIKNGELISKRFLLTKNYHLFLTRSWLEHILIMGVFGSYRIGFSFICCRSIPS